MINQYKAGKKLTVKAFFDWQCQINTDSQPSIGDSDTNTETYSSFNRFRSRAEGRSDKTSWRTGTDNGSENKSERKPGTGISSNGDKIRSSNRRETGTDSRSDTRHGNSIDQTARESRMETQKRTRTGTDSSDSGTNTRNRKGSRNDSRTGTDSSDSGTSSNSRSTSARGREPQNRRDDGASSGGNRNQSADKPARESRTQTQKRTRTGTDSSDSGTNTRNRKGSRNDSSTGRNPRCRRESNITAIPNVNTQQLKQVAGILKELWEEFNRSSSQLNSAGQDAQVTSLKKIEEEEQNEGVFPVYGAVKAGKSTFLSCIIKESILPAQSLPMTSIPIKITHSPGIDRKYMEFKQLEKWNNCLKDFSDKLISGTLPKILTRESGDDYLFHLQEKIRNNNLVFKEMAIGDDIGNELKTFSHFVRLLWFNEIDFETNFEISLNIDQLPEVHIDMKSFENLPMSRFSFLDTPGPNEDKALAVLKRMNARIIANCTGCIFCVPYDQVAASQQRKLYVLINQTMAGKTVIVIVTKWDSATETDEGTKESIKNTIKMNFLETIRENLIIHFTSGFKLTLVFKLENILEQCKGSSREEFISAVKKDRSLLQGLDKAFYFSRLIEAPNVFEILSKLVEDEKRNLAATAVIEDFNNLYLNSELLAIQGNIATIKNSYNEFTRSLKLIEEYAKANIEEQQKMRDQLENMNNIFTSVLSQVDAIPDDLDRAVDNILVEHVFDPLEQWASTNDDWKIVYVDETTENTAEEDDFDQTLKIRGARLTGKIRCSLQWYNSDDLDLHCKTPSGQEIYFGKKQADGGDLDVDMNAGTGTSSFNSVDPCENINFENPTAGHYTFFVVNYNARGNTNTNYKVRLVKGNRREDKDFPHLGNQQEREAFSFDWDGSSGDSERIEFLGGILELHEFLEEKAQPKFTKLVTKKFCELMLGKGGTLGAISQIRAKIEALWKNLDTLIEKIKEFEPEDTHFIEFRRPPSWHIDTTAMAEDISKFDLTKITHFEERDRVILRNSVFRQDVLKGFKELIQNAIAEIKDTIKTALNTVLQKFQDAATTAKSTALSTQEKLTSIQSERLSKRDIEDLLESINRKIPAFKESLQKLELSVDNKKASR